MQGLHEVLFLFTAEMNSGRCMKRPREWSRRSNQSECSIVSSKRVILFWCPVSKAHEIDRKHFQGYDGCTMISMQDLSLLMPLGVTTVSITHGK